jgi:hypothetical protein
VIRLPERGDSRAADMCGRPLKGGHVPEQPSSSVSFAAGIPVGGTTAWRDAGALVLSRVRLLRGTKRLARLFHPARAHRVKSGQDGVQVRRSFMESSKTRSR